MLRLDPGEGRIRTARPFQAWEGGGEYNVARGLRRCFGQRTAVVTAFADNDVGRLLEDFVLQGGVDTSLIRWVPSDGIGRTVRNGLNFTERGFGVRGALGVSDRGNTAASQLRPGDIDWEHLFGTLGVRWLHTGGIFAALSDTTPEVVVEAVAAAKRHGTVVSYDLNYRPSLWKGIGGVERAREVNRRIAAHIDVMIGNEEDFTACLGLEVEGADENLTELDTGVVPDDDRARRRRVPELRGRGDDAAHRPERDASTTGRRSPGRARQGSPRRRRGRASRSSIASAAATASRRASIYGLLELGDLGRAVEYGAAHGALAMTTPGDTSTATLAEVEELVRGASARIQR